MRCKAGVRGTRQRREGSSEQVGDCRSGGWPDGRTGVERSTVREVVDAVFEVIAEAQASGEEARVEGLGIFGTRGRTPRTGRNPWTGECVEVAASTAPAFRADKSFNDAVKARAGREARE